MRISLKPKWMDVSCLIAFTVALAVKDFQSVGSSTSFCTRYLHDMALFDFHLDVSIMSVCAF